jgi:hypothetical protein
MAEMGLKKLDYNNRFGLDDPIKAIVNLKKELPQWRITNPNLNWAL